MSSLRYLCLLEYSSFQTHIVLCFLFCLSSSCVPYVANFSRLSVFDCSFSNVYLTIVGSLFGECYVPCMSNSTMYIALYSLHQENIYFFRLYPLFRTFPEVIKSCCNMIGFIRLIEIQFISYFFRM